MILGLLERGNSWKSAPQLKPLHYTFQLQHAYIASTVIGLYLVLSTSTWYAINTGFDKI
jgi:hypothetical protein